MLKNIQTFLLSKNKLIFLLLLSVGFSFSLLFFRMVHTRSFYYGFLLWNLFLASIPLFISSLMLRRKNKPWFQFILPGFFWLLFLPNAPYIITDFIHLGETATTPLWFDMVLILSFAWNGLVFWLISMFQFNFILSKFFNSRKIVIINQGIILLSAVGVYIGRYGRWNSWDAFSTPIEIIEKVIYMAFHPISYPGFYGMTIAVYIFLALLFSFIQGLSNPSRFLSLSQPLNHEV